MIFTPEATVHWAFAPPPPKLVGVVVVGVVFAWLVVWVWGVGWGGWGGSVELCGM